MYSATRISAFAALAAATSLVASPIPAGASQNELETDQAAGLAAAAPRANTTLSWQRGESDVMSRGERRGQSSREPDQTEEPTEEEQEDECPTELWTIPLEIKGVACILLLGKPAGDDSGPVGG
ncbi:MAG TPA: hypothetical protein VEG38_15415 [Acidimicrobiia bacterium]|nr:hypothetical protein [Acidimicrobiia bacterium]